MMCIECRLYLDERLHLADSTVKNKNVIDTALVHSAKLIICPMFGFFSVFKSMSLSMQRLLRGGV